jgi:hypothetical protein
LPVSQFCFYFSFKFPLGDFNVQAKFQNLF